VRKETKTEDIEKKEGQLGYEEESDSERDITMHTHAAGQLEQP
jgi:hypothetical protein